MARKMVILCCGALGTPGILERSGIGDPEVLTDAGIELQVDLPGVGAELDDHQASPPHPAHMNEMTDTETSRRQMPFTTVEKSCQSLMTMREVRRA